MSSRRPLNDGARSVRVRVHSANSTSATSFGSTHTGLFSRGGLRPVNGAWSARSFSSRACSSRSVRSVKPVPTRPA